MAGAGAVSHTSQSEALHRERQRNAGCEPPLEACSRISWSMLPSRSARPYETSQAGAATSIAVPLVGAGRNAQAAAREAAAAAQRMGAQASAGAEAALAPLRLELAAQLEALGQRSSGDSRDAAAAAARLEGRLAVRLLAAALHETARGSSGSQHAVLPGSDHPN